MALDRRLRSLPGSGRRPENNQALRSSPIRSRRPPIREFVKAAVDGDFRHATDIALSFLDQTESRVLLFSDLFHAAQQHVEERWHVGQATVADEFAVYLAIEGALAAIPDPPAHEADPAAPTIVLATLNPEEHDLGLRLLAASFAEAGWTVDLRVRVEGPELVAIAARDRRRIVGISATFMSSRARAALAATVAGLKGGGSRVLGGGAAFIRSPALGQQLGLDFVATDARFAVLYASHFTRSVRTGTARTYFS